MTNNIFPTIKKTISKFLLDESAEISKKSIIRLGLFGCLGGFAAINLAKPVVAAQQFPDVHFNCIAVNNCDASVAPVAGLETYKMSDGTKKYYVHGNGFFEEYNDEHCDIEYNGYNNKQKFFNIQYPAIKAGGDWVGLDKNYDTQKLFGPDRLVGPISKMFDNNNFAHNNNMNLGYKSAKITATHDHSVDFCDKSEQEFRAYCDSGGPYQGVDPVQSNEGGLVVACYGDEIIECDASIKEGTLSNIFQSYTPGEGEGDIKYITYSWGDYICVGGSPVVTTKIKVVKNSNSCEISTMGDNEACKY